MSFNDREQKILDILYEKNAVRSSELAKQLYVSISTLRRDLEKLEEKRLIRREHGLCRLSSNLSDDKFSYKIREQQSTVAKKRIALEASKLIKDGNNIMLDGSSTAYGVLRFLDKCRDLLVISNSAKVAMALSDTDIRNISTGGTMAKNTVSFVGQEAINAIQKYNADIFFFSCRGITEEGYLTDSDKEENDVRREMMKYAERKVALIDSSKMGKKYLYNLCHVSEVDDVISEEELPDYIMKYIKSY